MNLAAHESNPPVGEEAVDRMNVFTFDPAQYREQFLSQGWIVIKNGASPEFVQHVSEFVEHEIGSDSFDDFAIAGKKGQARYEFPGDANFPNELFDAISVVCDLDRDTIALSERHINAYDKNANPNPAPHKDRDASKISCGVCIDPSDSELVIYPDASRELNPFTSAATYYASLPADQKPEVALTPDQEVVIKDEPGDVMMFYGSAIWHMRRNSARSVNLYMKFNDFDYDPLGEDPNTIERQARSRQLLSANGSSLPEDAIAKVSRQLESLTTQRSRNEIDVRQAKLWGQDPVLIDEDELQLLQTLNGGATVGSLDQGLVRRLAERGLVDLVARS
jgi:hypothetical protein